MKPLLAVVLIAALTGCAQTVIKYEHRKPTGEVIRGSYNSTKNLVLDYNPTNGIVTIRALASEATDANTRLIKQATESVIQLSELGAKKVALP